MIIGCHLSVIKKYILLKLQNHVKMYVKCLISYPIKIAYTKIRMINHNLSSIIVIKYALFVKKK